MDNNSDITNNRESTAQKLPQSQIQNKITKKNYDRDNSNAQKIKTSPTNSDSMNIIPISLDNENRGKAMKYKTKLKEKLENAREPYPNSSESEYIKYLNDVKMKLKEKNTDSNKLVQNYSYTSKHITEKFRSLTPELKIDKQEERFYTSSTQKQTNERINKYGHLFLDTQTKYSAQKVPYLKVNNYKGDMSSFYKRSASSIDRTIKVSSKIYTEDNN